MSRRRWPFAKWLSVMGPWWRRIVLGTARRPGGFGGSGPPGAGLSEGGVSRVRLDRSQKTPSNQLIQRGRSNICHQDSLAQMWKARSPLEGHSYDLRLLILVASASGGLGRPCVQHQHLLMLTCAGLALLPDRPGPAVSPTVGSAGPYGPVASRARMTCLVAYAQFSRDRAIRLLRVSPDGGGGALPRRGVRLRLIENAFDRREAGRLTKNYWSRSSHVR
jgi:hypothetical protein